MIWNVRQVEPYSYDLVKSCVELKLFILQVDENIYLILKLGWTLNFKTSTFLLLTFGIYDRAQEVVGLNPSKTFQNIKIVFHFCWWLYLSLTFRSPSSVTTRTGPVRLAPRNKFLPDILLRQLFSSFHIKGWNMIKIQSLRLSTNRLFIV